MATFTWPDVLTKNYLGTTGKALAKADNAALARQLLSAVSVDEVASMVATAVGSAEGPQAAAAAAVATAVAGLDLLTAEQIRALGLINVMDPEYGAYGDGEHDDTDAIKAAFAVKGAIYAPPGDYIFNATGLDFPDSDPGSNVGNLQLKVWGAGAQQTRFILGDDSYLLTPTGQMDSLNVRDLSTSGGKGVFKSTRTASSSAEKYTVQNCYFADYTECVIAHESTDMPYWIITGNIFYGPSGNTTIGIALSGLTDQCLIYDNAFFNNRVHVKMRVGGNNAHIFRNDFLRFSLTNTAGPRIDVWIVPSPIQDNSGTGFEITGNKFGSENTLTGDKRIVYADELSGASNGARFPDLSTASTGYISGHNIHDQAFFGSATGVDLIYSTTPTIRHLAMTNIHIGGTHPDCVLKYLNPEDVGADRANSNNVFGPFFGELATETSPGLKLSNVYGVGQIIDPNGVLQTRWDVPRTNHSGSSVTYKSLLTGSVTTFNTSNATITPSADVYGGSDAAVVEFTNGHGTIYKYLSDMTPGLPGYLAVDIENSGEEDALSQVYIMLQETDPFGPNIMARMVEVPAVGEIQTCRIPWTSRTNGNTPAVVIGSGPDYATNPVGTVKVSRVRVYHGHEPQIGDDRPTITGSRDGNAALEILLTALERMGLIVDSTDAGTIDGGAP